MSVSVLTYLRSLPNPHAISTCIRSLVWRYFHPILRMPSEQPFGSEKIFWFQMWIITLTCSNHVDLF